MYFKQEVLTSSHIGWEDDLHRVVHAARARSESAVDGLSEEDAARLRVWTWCGILDEDIAVGYYLYLCLALDRYELHRVLEREFNDFLCHRLEVDFARRNIQIVVDFTREYPPPCFNSGVDKNCLSFDGAKVKK